MNEWKELKTLQEVAEAQAAGDEIERLWKHTNSWTDWTGDSWDSSVTYRSRPAKKTKTVSLREALVTFYDNRWFAVWGETEAIETIYRGQPIKWLDTPERIVEVDE